jgi:hypothetical protein
MTVLLFLVLLLLLLRVWSDLGAAREQMRRLGLQVDRQQQDADVAMADLKRRVSALEGRTPAVAAPAAVIAVPAPAQAPPTPALAAPVVVPPSASPVLPPLREASVELARSESHVGRVPLDPRVLSDPASLPPVGPVLSDPAMPPPAATAPETWEVTVGTNWLNRIGVLVLVIGLALLLGYSMNRVGPLGRVAIGFAISLAMLGTGAALERRAPYRAYAYGLIGGGWAGMYFTTYAMHALPAARVVTSEYVGAFALIAVAAGMIVHSLRYRSETVSALAYIAAYAPLTFTTLNTFSLVAAIPLTVSLLVVAERYQWARIVVLGVVSAYGIFAFRLLASIGPPPALGAVYAIVGAYWITFEIADIASQGGRKATSSMEPLFVLNAVGLLGTLLLYTRLDADQWGAAAVAGVAYLASALVRACLLSRASQASDLEEATPFGPVHAATAVGCALLAVAIDLRMSGPRETIALLLEAQLLVASGLTLGDRYLRRIGAGVGAIATAHVVWLLTPVNPEAASGAVSLAAGLVAVCWYVNQEWLRRRSTAVDPIEQLYPWAAFGLVAMVIAREVPAFYRGAAAFAWSLALLEVGVRRDSESRAQAIVAFVIGALMTLQVYLLRLQLGGPEGLALAGALPIGVVWTILPLSAATAYGFAARVAVFARARKWTPETTVAAAVSLTFGTFVVALFEWHVAPADAVAPVWMASALAIAVLASVRRLAALRWQAYGLALFAGLRAVLQLTPATVAGGTLGSAGIVAALLYAVAAVSRRAPRTEGRGSDADADVAMGVVLPGLATYVLLFLAWRWVPPVSASALWIIIAASLLGVGVAWRVSDLRWQAYSVFTLGAWALLGQILVPRYMSGVDALTVGLSSLLLYVGSQARRIFQEDDDIGARSLSFEARCQSGLSVAATVLLAALAVDALNASLVTLTWAALGAALLVSGLLGRDRVLRLSGLTLLLLCIGKLFVYDLRELEALARIFSFVILGILLLAVSWVYTRYREQIRKLL